MPSLYVSKPRKNQVPKDDEALFEGYNLENHQVASEFQSLPFEQLMGTYMTH